MNVESGRNFFDTNVLVYLFAAGDPRCETAKQVAEQGGLVSVQVLNEFVSVSRHKLKLPWSGIEERLKRIHFIFEKVISLTQDTQSHAVGLAKKYGYDIYDANIIACALHAGCSVLYSEDMQDGQRIGDLTIRNPFTAPA